MSKLSRLSTLYVPTLKEDSADAELASHKLLLRAGMIRRAAAGIYSYLPFGFRVLKKIEDIVREEMDRIGCQELLLPVVQPAEIWQESGRWDIYGPELARLKDRHGREFCLGPTHEEIITTLIRGDLRSYRELPTTFYQINLKFRDEVRPRFGLLRGREFVMKDAYSFHASQESLDEHYEKQGQAYGRICERLGLEYRSVEADSGQIGGSVTREYMALADAGEDEIVVCDCGYAANTEVAEVINEKPLVSKEPIELKEVHTPEVKSIADVSAFLDVEEDHTVKAMLAKNKEGQLHYFFVPGSRELNEIKIATLFGELELLSDHDFEELGIPKGFVGPIGAPKDAVIVADRLLEDEAAWTVGASKVDYHITGANPGRDFKTPLYADITTVRDGDRCPKCGLEQKLVRGIEVSQIFQLGKRYSEALNATYLDENGKAQHFIMGCYGVGVSRSLAAVIEQHHDERGIVWPISVAPYEVAVIPLAKPGEELFEAALKIADELAEAGIEVVLDDRNERPGVKFADAELIGYPIQVVLGKKSFDAGIAELKDRAAGTKDDVDLDQIVESVKVLVAELNARYELD